MISLIRKLLNLKHRLKAKYYTLRVRRLAISCGLGLRENGKTSVTRNTVLGSNVNFNGMEIGGE